MDAANSKPEVDEGEMSDRYRARRNDAGREARWAKWREENAGAIADYDRWFEAEGHKFLRRPQF